MKYGRGYNKILRKKKIFFYKKNNLKFRVLAEESKYSIPANFTVTSSARYLIAVTKYASITRSPRCILAIGLTTLQQVHTKTITAVVDFVSDAASQANIECYKKINCCCVSRSHCVQRTVYWQLTIKPVSVTSLRTAGRLRTIRFNG